MVKGIWSENLLELSKGFFPIGYFLQKVSAYHYLVYYEGTYFFFRAILWASEIKEKHSALNFSLYNFQVFNTMELFSASTSSGYLGKCRWESRHDHSFLCAYSCWNSGGFVHHRQSNNWRKRVVLTVPHWTYLFFPHSREESSPLIALMPMIVRSSANHVIPLIPLNIDIFFTEFCMRLSDIDVHIKHLGHDCQRGLISRYTLERCH